MDRRGPLAGSYPAAVALVVATIVHQYRKRRPLMLLEQPATTFPVVGILVALAASAAAFGLMDLSLTALEQRFTPVYAIGGLVVLFAAAAVLAGVATGGACSR
jgi:hypothetical protein